MTLFDRIKNLAKKRDKSVKEVAIELGFSENLFYKWKSSEPKARDLEKVADYFNVTTDYLLGRTDNLSFTLEDSEIKKMDDKKKEDIRIIQRAAIEMSDDEREVAIDLWKAAFKKAFDESADKNDN